MDGRGSGCDMDSEMYQYFFATEFVDMFPQTNGDILLQSTFCLLYTSRRYIDRLGYDNSFTIYDTDDQKTLMKDICKYLQIDTCLLYTSQLLLMLVSRYFLQLSVL